MQCCTQVCRLRKPSQTLVGQCYQVHNPAITDFHLFRVQKNVNCSTKFETDDDVIHIVRTWLHEQNTAWYQQGIHTLALCWHRAIDLEGNFVGEKKGCGVKSSLFVTCNFCNLWINIYWEKNNRHYFLGSLPTVWLQVVKWFWCHFLQANIMIMGISKTFQMHLKPTVNLMVIMSSVHVVFKFTWWWSSIPTTITTHRWNGYNDISCE